MTDNINHPSHYTNGAIEAIDMIEVIVKPYDPNIGWSIGNVVKYLCRAPFKTNLIEDLKKAKWYLNRAIHTAERSAKEVVPDREPNECCGGISGCLSNNANNSTDHGV